MTNTYMALSCAGHWLKSFNHINLLTCSTSLWGNCYFYHPHFTYGEAEAQRSSNLFKVTQLMWGENWILVVWFHSLYSSDQIKSHQSLSRVRLFAAPWIAARQASLSLTNSQSSLRLMSIESVMPSNHLILCHPLLLLPPISPSIRVFSNEPTLCMRWPKYWSFSFNISPSN